MQLSMVQQNVSNVQKILFQILINVQILVQQDNKFLIRNFSMQMDLQNFLYKLFVYLKLKVQILQYMIKITIQLLMNYKMVINMKSNYKYKILIHLKLQNLLKYLVLLHLKLYLKNICIKVYYNYQQKIKLQIVNIIQM